MILDLNVVIDTVIKQVPNMVFAAIAIYYLAKQNQRAIQAMDANSERQFALLEKLCMPCNDKDKAST